MNSNDSTRLLPLDSLRGLAAFFVAFSWHYRHLVADAPPPVIGNLHWFYAYGYNLVDFFFVLSGFVFSHVYKQNIFSGKVRFSEYAILRLSRLYPLHVLTLLFVAGIQWFRMAGYLEPVLYPADFYHFLLNAVYLHSGWFENFESFNGPSWSICCEIIAYITFFSVLVISRKTGKTIFLYLGMILAGLYLMRTAFELPLFNYVMGRAVLGFFIGCVTYEISKAIRNRPFARTIVVGIVSVMLAGIWVMCTRLGMKEFLGEWELVTSLFIYPGVILLSLHVRILYKLLTLRPLAYLGEISYSVYMIHVPAQIALLTLIELTPLRVDMTSPLQYGIFILVVLGLSSASYELFEKPISKMARTKYKNRKLQKPSD